MVRRHELRMERGPCLKAPKARSATDMRRSEPEGSRGPEDDGARQRGDDERLSEHAARHLEQTEVG